MPLVESAGPGLTPGPLAFSATASCRKEKKKQAKEERDRLKQVEKKKRRLEKALATAAAIRAELEKKKQRRKEEERRLDEEAAALAEAVALQVLVDEESNELGQMRVATEGDSQIGRVGERRCHFLERIGDKTESIAACLSVRSTEPVHHHSGLKCHGSFKYSPGSDGNERETKEWKWNEWDACTESQEVSLRYDIGVEGELLEGAAECTWELYSCVEETVKTSNERAQAAEAVAGLSAAQKQQAVAALQIAEEAQAAKTAAEEAMNRALDYHHNHKTPDYLKQSSITAQCVEKERDELKGQLQETERKLHEKTCRVVELEHNLEEVTQYLLEFKAMVEGSKHCTQAMCDVTRHDKTGSKEGTAYPACPPGAT